jgi:deoxyribodipyrimidine photo-lyase
VAGAKLILHKLLDYELSSNVAIGNGRWYWLRCSPYFRVFNPEIQLKKFDEKEDISVSGYRI